MKKQHLSAGRVHLLDAEPEEGVVLIVRADYGPFAMVAHVGRNVDHLHRTLDEEKQTKTLWLLVYWISYYPQSMLEVQEGNVAVRCVIRQGYALASKCTSGFGLTAAQSLRNIYTCCQIRL